MYIESPSFGKWTVPVGCRCLQPLKTNFTSSQDFADIEFGFKVWNFLEFFFNSSSIKHQFAKRWNGLVQNYTMNISVHPVFHRMDKILVWNVLCFSADVSKSQKVNGGSGFPRRERQFARCRCQTIIWLSFFPWKLHENERNCIEMGVRIPSSPTLDPAIETIRMFLHTGRKIN